MEKISLMDKYPVYTKEISKTNTKIKNTDEFISVLKEKIDSDKMVKYITTFDHFEYTKNLWWEIMEWMIDWKILIFCFGHKIPNPLALALRPRNIAIAEFKDKFVVSFLEAPKQKANDKIISWILEHIEE